MPQPDWELLEFPVSLRDVETLVPEKGGEDEALSGLRVPNTKAIFREDSRTVLDLVSNKYKLIPHGEIFRPLDQAIRKLPFEVTDVTTRVGQMGGYASIEWKFDRQVEVQPGDKVDLSLIAKNSMNRSAKLQFELAAYRLLCSNGMRGPGPSFRKSWRHRRSLDEDFAIAWVSRLFDRVPDALDEWQRWVGKKIYVHRLQSFLEDDRAATSYIGKKAREAILERATEARGRSPHITVWDAYNCLTEYATHHVRTRKPGLLALRIEEIHSLALRFARSASKN